LRLTGCEITPAEITFADGSVAWIVFADSARSFPYFFGLGLAQLLNEFGSFQICQSSIGLTSSGGLPSQKLPLGP